jgi:hypothetical protein
LMRGTLSRKRLRRPPSAWMSCGSSSTNLSTGRLMYRPSARSPPRSCPHHGSARGALRRVFAARVPIRSQAER